MKGRNDYTFHDLKAYEWDGRQRVDGRLSIGPGPDCTVYLALDRPIFERLVYDLGNDPSAVLPPPTRENP